MTKISIIGSGRVGCSVAVHTIIKELGDLVLIDVVEGLPQGEALDLAHMAAILGVNVDVYGSNDFKDLVDSDIVVVTAGIARKPGMTREDLLEQNAKIIKDVCEKVKEYAPKAILIIVTNPLDVMTYLAWKITGFERSRVIGFSGILDAGRFRYYIAKKLSISPSDIEAVVLGQHGEEMIPIPRLTRVGAQALTELLTFSEIEEVIHKVVKAGEEITRLKKWSAYHAPGAGIALMIECIVKNQRKITPLTAILDGEYGYSDIALEVLAILGRNGVERIVELSLTKNEKSRLDKAASYVKSLIEKLKGKYI
ncbi:MAG: malate dehydrogenase [Thermoprotei archaeon ex4572_64]|nr:MAG: malate dehydrogenase [Thermoprotei archaeon ex4572_64]